jgi:hypothetical protein
MTQIGDPLADLAEPAAPVMPSPAPAPFIGACQGRVNNPLDPSGNLNVNFDWCMEGQPVIVYPGRYASFRVTTDANVVMQPGLYFIDGGNFDIDGDTDLNGSGVMVYLNNGHAWTTASSRVNLSAGANGILFHLDGNHPNAYFRYDGGGKLTLNGMIYVKYGEVIVTAGGGSDGVPDVTITAPGSGTYQGMAFFKGRSNTTQMEVSGGADMVITGTIYAPAATLNVLGGGQSRSITAQIIVSKVRVNGGAELFMTYNPDLVYGGNTSSSFVELAE